MTPRSEIFSGTGHRRSADGWEWTRRTLLHGIERLGEAGYTVGSSRLARGFDLILASCILEAGLRLKACVPFEEQTARWIDPADRAEWRRLRALADPELSWVHGELVETKRSPLNTQINNLLWEANERMVRESSFLITCWNPDQRSRSGTYGTIQIARRLAQTQPLSGIHLNPVTHEVHRGLPNTTREDR